MKKIQSVLLSILFTSVFFLPLQSVFAVDVPLKKNDPGSIGTMMLSRSIFTFPVSVTLDDTELGILFNSHVGNALISIVDETGSIVYQEVVDTNTTQKTVIDTGGFDSGNFTIRISYGTTNLIGTILL